MTTQHFLERMTWPEVEARLSAGVDAVLLPIGTTEQHGRHIPLDTDCVTGRGLAARNAAARTVAVNHYLEMTGVESFSSSGGTSRRTSWPMSTDPHCHSGPKMVVPMDMLRDITATGAVGDATRTTLELGERIVAAVIPRIVQVAREMSGKEL